MADTSSLIVSHMQEEGSWGLAPDVAVEVLPQEELIERYIDITAQGDTVIRGGGHIRIGEHLLGILNVAPWGEEERRQLAASIGPALHWREEDLIPKGPIPREVAEKKVQEKLDRLARIEAYQRSGRIKRAAHFLKFLTGRESNYVSMHEQVSQLPSVIYFRDNKDGKVHHIIINHQAERLVSD